MNKELKETISAFLDNKESSDIFSIMYNHIIENVKSMINVELKENRKNPKEINIVGVKENKNIFTFKFLNEKNTTVIYNYEKRRYFFIKLDNNGEIMCTKVLKSQSPFDNVIYELEDIDANEFESNRILDVDKLLKGLIE